MVGDSISGKIMVTNFEPQIQSVLGVPGDYELSLDGKIKGDGIEGSAGIAAFPDTKLVFKAIMLHKI